MEDRSCRTVEGVRLLAAGATPQFLLPAMFPGVWVWKHAEMPLRCLIVDDNAPFLNAAASFLQREGLTVVGLASSITDALGQARELRPDVILVDIMLGHESGFDLARRLTEADLGDPTVILISTHEEEDFAELIAEAPAAGFMSKSHMSASTIRRLIEAP